MQNFLETVCIAANLGMTITAPSGFSGRLGHPPHPQVAPVTLEEYTGCGPARVPNLSLQTSGPLTSDFHCLRSLFNKQFLLPSKDPFRFYFKLYWLSVQFNLSYYRKDQMSLLIIFKFWNSLVNLVCIFFLFKMICKCVLTTIVSMARCGWEFF